MRCRSPRTVGFQSDGKTIAWSQKNHSKEYAIFQLPCGKCVECRLEYGRQWAVRALHEAQMHIHNSFITLTYDDNHLGNNKLNYVDFQTFMKDLRQDLDYKGITHQIGFIAVGEYGAKTKRQHWHACLFGWQPADPKHKYTTELGHKVYTSDHLSEIWTKGNSEFGSVTRESAGYVARYSAKKLIHGKDQDHEYQPLFRASSKHAIGKKWLEQFSDDLFNYGTLVGIDGKPLGSIPRYYEKWLKKNRPSAWAHYVTQTKADRIAIAVNKSLLEELDQIRANHTRKSQDPLAPHQITRAQARAKIQDQKFKNLQDKLKL